MRYRCCCAPSGLVKKSAMFSLVGTQFNSMLCFRTESLTKKKFRSMLRILLFEPLSDATNTEARLSQKIRHLKSGKIDRTIRSRNSVKSTAFPRAMNSAPHVDFATVFWRCEPQAIGHPKHFVMKPDVERWNSPPQLASDHVVSCESSGHRRSFLFLVVRIYRIK